MAIVRGDGAEYLVQDLAFDAHPAVGREQEVMQQRSERNTHVVVTPAHADHANIGVPVHVHQVMFGVRNDVVV
jgi:glyoxylase-like metal-dependent hydrolase (beta-lactamase superfamily II)